MNNRKAAQFLAGLLIGLTCLLIAGRYYALSFSLTKSLPHTLYFVAKGELPARGQLVAYRWKGGAGYRKDSMMIKTLAGVPGDVVSRTGQDFYVRGEFVGTAKSASLTGQPLVPADAGILGSNEYFVSASHVDSLDSRYALVGRVPRELFIGRAYPIF